jgi:hypothetical protein
MALPAPASAADDDTLPEAIRMAAPVALNADEDDKETAPPLWTVPPEDFVCGE